MTCASHKDIQWFLRLDSCFVCPHVHPSFRHLRRSQQEHEEGWLFQRRVRCRLLRVFVVAGQIRTVPSTAGDASSPFSLCEQHSMEVGVLAEVVASKALRVISYHGSQIKISRRVVLVFRLCAVASISSTIKSCKREVTQDVV